MELIIDNKLKQRFDEVQRLYLDAVISYVPDYNIQTEIRDLSEIREDNIYPSHFRMDIKLFSKKYNKKIFFYYFNGLDIESKFHKSVGFSIRSDDKFFGLRDYFTGNNITYDDRDYFKAKGSKETFDNINKFIEQIVFLLERDDIKHILSSKDWLDVPHDKSMYF